LIRYPTIADTHAVGLPASLDERGTLTRIRRTRPAQSPVHRRQHCRRRQARAKRDLGQRLVAGPATGFQCGADLRHGDTEHRTFTCELDDVGGRADERDDQLEAGHLVRQVLNRLARDPEFLLERVISRGILSGLGHVAGRSLDKIFVARPAIGGSRALLHRLAIGERMELGTGVDRLPELVGGGQCAGGNANDLTQPPANGLLDVTIDLHHIICGITRHERLLCALEALYGRIGESRHPRADFAEV